MSEEKKVLFAPLLCVITWLYVDDLCDAIRGKFELPAATKLVVKTPEKSLPEATKPDSVDPTAFKRVLSNSEATLAEVLKRDIAGKDSTGKESKYRVYVELPAEPKEEGAAGFRGFSGKENHLGKRARLGPLKWDLSLLKHAAILEKTPFFIAPDGWLDDFVTQVQKEYDNADEIKHEDDISWSGHRTQPLCVAVKVGKRGL